MGAKLEALRELQIIESQIVDIRRQFASKERLAAAQSRKLAELRKSIERERLDIRSAQAEVDAVDLDLKARSANLAKLREHLNSVKTNKEYAALLSQLNNEKADTTRVAWS
jgi:predicted  nucleic acid-binding Zn-ribbon protein